MADEATARRVAAAAEAAQIGIRRERVHTTMMIELFVLLVFMAIAFGFFQREESGPSALDTLRNTIAVLEQKLGERDAEVSDLRRQLRLMQQKYETVAEANRRLLNRDITLQGNETIRLSKKQYDELFEQLNRVERERDAARATSGYLQAELNRLNAKDGRGGKDLPPCEVNTGYLVVIDFLPGGGVRVRPNWTAAEAPAVGAIPGLSHLASSRPLSIAEFRRYAGQVQAWGKSQRPIPCAFRARWTRLHGNADQADRQRRVVGQYFYLPL